ncbi:hypothetical protein MUP77_06440 [Candidatus Bathyarchaeota archaeon]|nr:hypothetical protein [Candidatus Bathyarchaeota archaeon]
MERTSSHNLKRSKQYLGIFIVGLSLTFASSIYQVKPLITDAEEIDYGFPFAWLSANRGAWGGYTPWNYNIQWPSLIGDLVFYSLITAVFLYLMIVKGFLKILNARFNNDLLKRY